MITQIIKDNEHLIGYVAKKYRISGYDQDDKVSIGRVVCWKCHKNYSRTKGNGAKFSTYLIKALNNKFGAVLRSTNYNDGPVINNAIDIDSLGSNKHISVPCDSFEMEFKSDLVKLFPDDTHKKIVMMLWQGYKMVEVQDHLKLQDKRYINRTHLAREVKHIRTVLSKYFKVEV